MVDTDNESPDFKSVADFVRAWGRFRGQSRICAETQFERDLGITGDDGVALLEAVEKKFEVDLASSDKGYRSTFGLGPDEYLFNAEGLGLGSDSVRAFTVGELHAAIRKAYQPRRRMQERSPSALAMQPSENSVQSVALLVANSLGAILYVFAASRGGWAIPAERAAGINSVTGEPFIWFLHVLPIVAIFFVIDVVWAIILAHRRWSGGRFFLLATVVWLSAIVVDFAHH